MTVTDVSRALSLQNAEIPGGRMDQGPQSITLRTRGRVQSVEEFDDIVVKPNQAHPVRIADVADVEDGMADADTIANINGTQHGAAEHPAAVRHEHRRGRERRQRAAQGSRRPLPPGYKLRIVRDSAEFIEASIHNVEEHLIVGSLLAAFVVLLFLSNLRSTIISAIAIPDVDHRDVRPRSGTWASRST